MADLSANDALSAPVPDSNKHHEDPENEQSIEVNGSQSLAIQESQETQDVTMSDQLGTSSSLENVLPESRIPAKKDATLREFLSKMDDHAPIVCRPF
jgi:transcription initiation factor TFIID subunit 10